MLNVVNVMGQLRKRELNYKEGNYCCSSVRVRVAEAEDRRQDQFPLCFYLLSAHLEKMYTQTNFPPILSKGDSEIQFCYLLLTFA